MNEEQTAAEVARARDLLMRLSKTGSQNVATRWLADYSVYATDNQILHTIVSVAEGAIIEEENKMKEKSDAVD